MLSVIIIKSLTKFIVKLAKIPDFLLFLIELLVSFHCSNFLYCTTSAIPERAGSACIVFKYKIRLKVLILSSGKARSPLYCIWRQPSIPCTPGWARCQPPPVNSAEALAAATSALASSNLDPPHLTAALQRHFNSPLLSGIQSSEPWSSTLRTTKRARLLAASVLH